jgi:hypothetical protein
MGMILLTAYLNMETWYTVCCVYTLLGGLSFEHCFVWISFTFYDIIYHCMYIYVPPDTISVFTFDEIVFFTKRAGCTIFTLIYNLATVYVMNIKRTT